MAGKQRKKERSALGGLMQEAVTDRLGYDPGSTQPPRNATGELAFPEFSLENVTPEYCCPRCSYEWRGNPLPGATETAEAEE